MSLLIGLMVLGLAVAGIVVFFVWYLLFKTESDQKKAEANADQLLNELFDGRPDVTFTTNMGSMKHETVVVGAKQRGYKLTNQNTGQYGYGALIFEKVATGDVPPA